MHRNYSHTLYMPIFLAIFETTVCSDPEILLPLHCDVFVYLFPNLRNCQLEPDGKLVPSPPSPNVQTSVKLCDIAELYLRSFSTNLPQTWPFYYFLGSLFRTKNEKSKDYCKADSEQLVLFFHKNISAGHTSLLQV